MKRRIDDLTKEDISIIIKKCKSFRELLLKLGYSSNGGGGYSNLKSHLKELSIPIPKYHYYGSGKSNPTFLLKEILIENSPYKSRQLLKRRLVRENLLEYKCKCGNSGEWQGEKLSLQLEHKNGTNDDNRLENLEFLCPNCHSQSPTFAGRNNRCSKKIKKPRIIKQSIQKYCSCGSPIKNRSKICQKCHQINQRKISNRPSYDELIKDMETLGGYSATGRKYNVSDNTIRKWLQIYKKMN